MSAMEMNGKQLGTWWDEISGLDVNKPLTLSDDELRAVIQKGKQVMRMVRGKLIELAEVRDARTNEAEAAKLLERLGPDVIKRAAELAQRVETKTVAPSPKVQPP